MRPNGGWSPGLARAFRSRTAAQMNPSQRRGTGPPSQLKLRTSQRAEGAVGPGVVLLERRGVARPPLEDGRDDAPRLLGLVAADRQGAVCAQHVEQDSAVGG